MIKLSLGQQSKYMPDINQTHYISGTLYFRKSHVCQRWTQQHSRWVIDFRVVFAHLSLTRLAITKHEVTKMNRWNDFSLLSISRFLIKYNLCYFHKDLKLLKQSIRVKRDQLFFFFLIVTCKSFILLITITIKCIS